MSKKMDVKHCIGCTDNFYNGNNDIGVSECWMRKDAKRERFLLIPSDMRPPYNSLKSQFLPTCYRRNMYVKVKRDVLTKDGFWK